MPPSLSPSRTTRFLLLGVIALTNCAPPVTWATNAPALPLTPSGARTSEARIKFVSPVHDFGTVTVGQIVQHDFAFTNVGTEKLVISEVRTTCGCASIGTGSRQVDPGQIGKLPVEFHTGAFDGPVAKTLTVVCNDASQPTVTLEMKGVVWHPMVATPANAAFVGALDTPSSLTKTIVITNRETEPLTFSFLETSHKAISATLRTNRAGEEYELAIQLVPPLGSGNLFGEVKLKTSSPKMPLLKIPVWVVAQPPVLVLPLEVSLPPGPLTNELTQTVAIRNNSTAPLLLTHAKVDAEGVQLETAELQPGKHFAARLMFAKGFTVPAGKAVALTIQTSNPKFPVIRVPIIQK